MQGTLEQDSTRQWWYIHPNGEQRNRRYERTCSSCGREDIVQKLDLHRVCRDCYKRAPTSAVVLRSSTKSITYLDDNEACWQLNLKNGIRHLLHVSKCSECGTERYVREDDIYSLCNSCSKKGRETPEHVRLQRSERMQGANNINWKGGKGRTHQGYIVLRLPDSPYANASGNVYEHRMVAAQNLGRPLKPYEEVHHIDEDKENNVWENLLVCSGTMHRAIHADLRKNRSILWKV